MPEEPRSALREDMRPSVQPAPRSRKEVLILFVRSSPWLSIAALLHVLVFTIFSVIYIAHEQSVERQRDTAARIAAAPVLLPPPAIEEPPLFDRSLVPVLLTEPRQASEVVNPDPVYVPDAAPGRVGEITPETALDREAGIYNPDPAALATLPSGAPGGTPIGVGAVGHKSTGTSAFSSRIPGGGGKGDGGLGQEGGGGPTQSTRQATLAALLWLERHQSPDGRWSAAHFGEQCRKNLCGGPGNPLHDVGLTGLALLCFLGAGETNETERFGATVRKGLTYLIRVAQQPDDGCFGERIGQHWAYDHACATLALAEAYGMTGQKALREPAQLGVNFILRARNPYAAWRYAYPPDGDNDSSVTGWMVMALKSAALAGLTIDPSALDQAVGFVEELTDPVSGRTGYTAMGETPSRLPALASSFPPERSEALTAVGMLVRIFGGRTSERDAQLGRGADLLVKKLPVWDTSDGSIYLNYWYNGTLALHKNGGTRWERWNAALEDALIANQRKDPNEDEYGSWDPVDPWGTEGGRVYATALNCLTTEVYYRYPRVFGTRK